MARPFLLGWLSGIATVAVAGALVGATALLGGFDTSATRQHSAPVARLLHTTMRSNVRVRAQRVGAPPRFDRSRLLAGARLYDAHCLDCHGAPGIGRARWASGLVPTPPYLLDASGRWSSAELYAILHDGVKMTAMPAWGEVRSDREIWDLVVLLEAMPKLTPAQFARLRQAAARRPAS